MARPLPELPLGVYVHVPFCTHLCPYCDFAVAVVKSVPHLAYLDAVLAELDARAESLAGRHLESIYFGGGTPALWNPECLAEVIRQVRSRWPAARPLEITVEANPEHADAKAYAALMAAGVNRVSLGVQSFNPQTLRSLGRRHTPEQARASVAAAADAGFERITVDLIFAAPEQQLEDWATDLDCALALSGVGHLSLYQLTIEPRTVFGRRVETGKQPPPDDELGAQMYDHAANRLREQGFVHYEVSSWARPGHQSHHNGLYWTGAEYLGLGVGAHSLAFGGDGLVLRRANSRQLKRWLADPVAGGAEIEHVPERVHLAERMMTGLRTREGVDLQRLQACLELDVHAHIGEELSRLEAEGLLIREGRVVRPTATGLRLADRVAERLLP